MVVTKTIAIVIVLILGAYMHAEDFSLATCPENFHSITKHPMEIRKSNLMKNL